MNNIETEMEAYNVVWTSPGRSDRSSMPLGNGEVGINVWVEEGGDLQFYIARTDAITELDRTVKLGKVSVRLESNPFHGGAPFRQELQLMKGIAAIEAGMDTERVRLEVFVDADAPVVYVCGTFEQPTVVTAIYESWRTSERMSPSDSTFGTYPPKNICESADVVRAEIDNILFYHRNGESCIPFHAEQQGVLPELDKIPDMLTNRIFGGVMNMEADASIIAAAGKPHLITSIPVTAFTLKIVTQSAQESRLQDWESSLYQVRDDLPDFASTIRRTEEWWSAYWMQSWIFIKGDASAAVDFDQRMESLKREVFQDKENGPSAITRAYILTKWMMACSGRGRFPILFNGSLFTLMPGENQHYSVDNFASTFTSMPLDEPNLEINPDERSWSHMNLWQNIRLPYHSMLNRGETPNLRVLFAYYRRFWELNRARARIYYGAEGQHNTEITTNFGLMPAWVYGYNRESVPAGVAVNRHGGAVDISPGLELAFLMLDFYAFTSDIDFLQDEALIYARDLMQYIVTRFPEREHGKIVIHPVHSLETYWDTCNSLPIVAGMHAVLDEILSLPEEIVGNRSYFEEIRKLTPELPIEHGDDNEAVIMPAERYNKHRNNVEIPEAYATFPFRLYGIGKPGLATAIRTLKRGLSVSGGRRPFTIGNRPDYASFSGWQQVGMNAAMLGWTELAKQTMESNCQLCNPGFRFPAMWGPIYDAVPDIDHGANILNTLQMMVLQTDKQRILLLPAWPKEWDVHFKLHAPGNTTIECEYRSGKLIRLEVEPAYRRKDVIFGAAIEA